MTNQTTEQRLTSTLAELEPPAGCVAVVVLRATEDRNLDEQTRMVRSPEGGGRPLGRPRIATPGMAVRRTHSRSGGHPSGRPRIATKSCTAPAEMTEVAVPPGGAEHRNFANPVLII